MHSKIREGQYTTVASMDGANTDDTSNLMKYVGLFFIILEISLYIIYKSKADS